MNALISSSGTIALFSLLALLTVAPLSVSRRYTGSIFAILLAASLIHGFSGMRVDAHSFAILTAIAALSALIAAGITACAARTHRAALHLIYASSLFVPAHVFMLDTQFASLDNPIAISAALWFVVVVVLHARSLASYLAHSFQEQTARTIAWVPAATVLILAFA